MAAARRSLLPYVLVLVWFVWAAALTVAAYGLMSRPRPSDVAIVYGSLVRDGRPSPRLEARLAAARDVYVQGLVPRLFVSGATGREGYDESRVMRDWLVAHAVPESVVVRDSLGHNSALTAQDARVWMRAHGAKQALVVTSYYHVARASMACWQAGIEVNGAAPARRFELRDIYSIARELVALPVYAVRGTFAGLTRH
jgi:vancomycin permeability regulator SanA